MGPQFPIASRWCVIQGAIIAVTVSLAATIVAIAGLAAP